MDLRRFFKDGSQIPGFEWCIHWVIQFIEHFEKSKILKIKSQRSVFDCDLIIAVMSNSEVGSQKNSLVHSILY